MRAGLGPAREFAGFAFEKAGDARRREANALQAYGRIGDFAIAGNQTLAQFTNRDAFKQGPLAFAAGDCGFVAKDVAGVADAAVVDAIMHVPPEISGIAMKVALDHGGNISALESAVEAVMVDALGRKTGHDLSAITTTGRCRHGGNQTGKTRHQKILTKDQRALARRVKT